MTAEPAPEPAPAASRPATLYVVATPIGNLEDATYRAVRILGSVDALACEDTRHTRLLLQRYAVPPRVLIAYHEYNEEPAGRRILKLLAEGRSVALCSNAGCPALSDPGYRVISAALEQGFRVEVLPGASAITTALVVSGLPTSSFLFKGFAPRKPGKRAAFLAAERDAPHTLVFFEAPQRLGAFLDAALAALGDRQAAVCVELTKMFEHVARGYLADLAAQFREKTVKGEVTVVVAGNHPKFIRGTATRCGTLAASCGNGV